MKKDLHDLLYTVWIDERAAMIMRDEPQGTHHFEVMHHEIPSPDRFQLQQWAKEVAHKIRYAQVLYILGSGEVRHLLQHEIENNKELHNVVITNSSCNKLSREEFEEIAKENMMSL